jgi:hypothetical protein
MNGVRAPQSSAAPELLTFGQPGISRAWHWIAEARSHRVLCFLVGLWLINLFDLALTLISHRQGLLQEANPVAAFMLTYGADAVCFFKCVLVVVGSAILYHYRRRLVAEFSAATLLVVYALVAVQWKWCYELYELSHTGNVSNAEITGVGTWVTEIPIF